MRLVVEREREIRAFVAREYWTIDVDAPWRPDGTTFEADLVRIDGAQARDRRRRRRRGARPRASTPAGPSSTTVGDEVEQAQPGRRRSRRRPCSRRRAASSASARSGRWRSPSGSTRASRRRDGQVGLITYMRTDSVGAVGPGARRGPRGDRGPLRDGLHDARRAAGLPDEVAERPGGARGDPADLVRPRPEELAPHLGRDEARLYRLIWQRALASQMKEKELETTTVDLAAGALRPARDRDQDALRRLRRGLHRGARRRRGRGRADAPRAARRRRHDASSDVVPTQHFTEPPPRYTEASLVKALEENGIGRPSTYAATISTIVDRGLRRHPRAAPPPGAGGRDRHRPPRRPLRRVRRPRVHGPDGGGARRGRPRRAGLGAAPGGLLRRRSGSLVETKRRELAPRATSPPRRRTRSARWATRW